MKRLHVDLETSYLIGATWQMWDTSVAQVLQDPYILGFGYAWDHLPGVHWVGMSDFPAAYRKDHTNDRRVMEALHALLTEADVAIAHNGKSFDFKKIKGRFLHHGMPPPPPFEIVDTKLVAKQFGYPSNKLDELARTLLGQRKIKHEGIELWTRCMSKKIDRKAWKMMGDYCKQDVVLLKRLYQRMLPWIDNHPNWNIHEDMPPGCPNCGGVGQIRGSGFTRSTEYIRMWCKRCPKWFRGPTIRKVKYR